MVRRGAVDHGPPRSAEIIVGAAVIDSDAYVTLFVTGQLMGVSFANWAAGDDPRPAQEVAGGLQGPHTVLA